MRSHLEGRLRFGYAEVEDNQMLNGSGVGQNLRGLRTAATAYTGGGGTKIDMLRRALTQLQNADFEATGIVLHPNDFEDLELAKDGDGNYVIGAPKGAAPSTLWSKAIVVTRAMPASNFLVIDGTQAAEIHDRLGATLAIGVTDTDFVRNLVVLRVEGRLGLSRPKSDGITKGSFGS